MQISNITPVKTKNFKTSSLFEKADKINQLNWALHSQYPKIVQKLHQHKSYIERLLLKLVCMVSKQEMVRLSFLHSLHVYVFIVPINVAFLEMAKY